MENNKIAMKVERTIFHKVIESLSLIILVAIATDTVLSLENLPNNVPIYASFDGVLSGFVSNKVSILVFSVFALIGLVVCNLLGNNPSKLTYKVKITEENCRKQYSLATSYMKILGLEIVMVFSYLQFRVTRATLNGIDSIGGLHNIIFIIMLIVTAIIYKMLSKKKDRHC